MDIGVLVVFCTPLHEKLVGCMHPGRQGPALEQLQLAQQHYR